MIISSAVWHEGKLYTAKRHCECIRNAVQATGIRPCIGDQGFMTDDGRYLSRAEAARHALACGQVQELKYFKQSQELDSSDVFP